MVPAIARAVGAAVMMWPSMVVVSGSVTTDCAPAPRPPIMSPPRPVVPLWRVMVFEPTIN